MSDPRLADAPAPNERPTNDRLDSWKEIAAYLRRDITTVQRWEKREGMPVHRHVHEKKGSVYAFKAEIDGWARSRKLLVTSEDIASDPLGDQPDPSAVGGGVEPTIESIAPGRRPSTVQPRTRSRVVWASIAAALILAAVTTWWLLESRAYFWRNPLADAAFQNVTDFAGIEEAAAISRDGRFAAFLSDRDGRMDVWVTQLGTGQFYNLTSGRIPELVNPSVRTLGFSPDGALVTFWTRDVNGSDAGDIAIWAVPTLGGEPRLYLEGVAEFDWSNDGRLVYHTPGPGDPMFVRDSGQDRQIFAAAAGLHAHFPVWSPNGSFIYFVQGSVPDAMDIWRIRPTGGAAERITHHDARVSHPVLLDDRTLLYLAGGRDGSGPWMYSIDVDRRVSQRVSAGLERYTSLAASADSRQLLATLASPKGTLWRVRIDDVPAGASEVTPVALTTGSGFAPRLAPGYLLYVSSKAANDSIWKLANGAASEVWSAPDARVIGGPEIARNGQSVAFSVEQRGTTLLYVMNADGTAARVITKSLQLRGAPAWAPDGESIASAALVDGSPHLFRIALDGAAVPLVRQYAVDPLWSPAGEFLVYSGADIGTTFAVKAVSAAGAPYPFPDLALTRGARRRFFPGRRSLVLMRGEIRHKNLWLVDLETGAERQLTNLPSDFNVLDFDVSPDGREVILERRQEHSDIVLVELARRE